MLVSVYIATQNRAALLRRAVASVLAQTHRELELVVVDDGSRDETRAYLESLRAPFAVRPIFFATGQGACAARNAAIRAARGELVTGLDDDDLFLPERVAALVRAWQGLGAAAATAGLYTDQIVRGAGGEVVIEKPARVSYAELRRANRVGSQIFAPKRHFVESGLFDPALPAWQDWEAWLRMARRFGDFRRAGGCSYVSDQSHPHERISQKSGEVLREAHARLLGTLGPTSRRERAALLASLFEYPQVRARPGELAAVAAGGEFRAAAKAALGAARALSPRR
jgi:glycosyltransferase involved in cell wall biosynthesis